jgi:hypothetical protein
MTVEHHSATESIGALAAKGTPPVAVSISTLWGYHVSDLVLWLTLIYTLILILHKLWCICHEFQGERQEKRDADKD